MQPGSGAEFPPKAADQKRKRGRPPNAPKTGDASPGSPGVAEAEPNELVEDAVDTPTPAKRGRPKKNKEPEASPSNEDPKAKRRGRPRREEVIEEEPQPAQANRKSRKAAKGTTNNIEEASKEDEPSQSTEKPTRGETSRKAAQEADEEARDEDEASAKNATKKKRGRPPKVAEEPTDEQSAEPEPAPKKKRGRPSLNKEPVTAEPAEAAEEEPAPKKRGRKPKEKAVEVEEPAPEEEVQAEPAPKKKRGRRPNAAAAEADEPPADEEPAAVKKKRGRPAAHTEPEAQEASQSEPNEARRRKGRPSSPLEEPAAEKPTKKRRKRPSQGEEEPSEPSPETQRRRPGRPRASDAASSPQVPEDQAPKPRKSKKRPSGDDDAADEAPAKKRRRRTSDEIRQQQQQQPRAEATSVRRSAPKHRHIAPRVRQVPRSIIEEKWSPLAPPSLAHVSSLLRLAERPVLQRLAANEKRRDQAASAIRLVTNRLTKKLSRGLPFPPAAAPPTGSANTRKADADGGRAQELDFERVIEGVAALEKQLDPLLHAVELLKAERERDERALEADYDSLRTLEANAKSEARNFKDNLRKTHVLVPEQKKVAGRNVVGDEHDLKFVPDESVGGTLFKDLEDDELRGLAGQVGNHMESMRNNLQPIDGVVPQIVRSRAALQDVLYKHLDQQSYEKVLLG
ncbi:kinetochore protein fta7 [Colletotrichum tofieldiae]|uniref:Kinetochore protein fta7 n=1 Tax=Colletotrichum tofieldiae TaxID=708197 RepID=A0A161V404_9PEZI|nr:kinetochore protein fta7 [Colletotrichum tofieldiae]